MTAERVHRTLGFWSLLTSSRCSPSWSSSVLPRGLCTADEEKKPKGVWPPFKVKTSARTPSGNN